MPMNNKQVRVIDPVLTTVARGYSDPQFVGNRLFPVVPVNTSGGQIITFNKDSWRKHNLRRAPGGAVVQIDYGYAGDPYSLVQDSVEGKVPREHLRDGAQSPGINHGTIAVNTAMSAIMRAQEIDQATAARNASAYGSDNKLDLTASSWFNPDRNPVPDIVTAKQSIADQTGFEPTVLLLSAAAWNALSTNPHVIGLFTRGEVETMVLTPAMVAAKLDLAEIVVGRISYINEQGAMVRAWGVDAVLAYTNIGSMSNALPSYGYTYQLVGNPSVEPSYWDPGHKSWMYPVNNEYSAVIAGSDAGYLFIGAGASFSG